MRCRLSSITDTILSLLERFVYFSTDEIFGPAPNGIKYKEDDPFVAFEVTFMLNKSRTIHKRSIYTALDWLGDVGGLLDGLRLIGGVVMFFYSLIFGNPLNNFLLSKLFMKIT